MHTPDFSRATRLIWTAVGCPPPTDGEGRLLPADLDTPETCSMCGSPDGRWAYRSLFSENYWPTRTLGQLKPYGTNAFCAACVFCARSLALRCESFCARPDGLRFVPKRELLALLLDPPEPPFVIAVPLYGISHGSEAHRARAYWPGAPPPPPGEVYLPRYQAKHTAVYAHVATSRARFVLQVDDNRSIVLDVALWRTLAERLRVIAEELIRAGLFVTATRTAMRTLVAPTRAPIHLLARWFELTKGLKQYAYAEWWPVLCDLITLPDRDELLKGSSPANGPEAPACPKPSPRPNARFGSTPRA